MSKRVMVELMAYHTCGMPRMGYPGEPPVNKEDDMRRVTYDLSGREHWVSDLTSGQGVRPDDYLSFFGEPDRVRKTKLPTGVNQPPLPGMEDQDLLYAETLEQMQDLLDRLKADAFREWAGSEDRCVEGPDGEFLGVLLTGDEADRYIEDAWEPALVMSLMAGYAERAFQDFRDGLEELLGEHKRYRVLGTNLDWRHSSGSLIMEDADADKVLALITAGDYTPTLEPAENGFTLYYTHHDCPVNPTVLEFQRI